MFLSLEDVQEQKPMGPVPPGSYLVVVREAEVKNARTAGGQYIKLKLVISGGPYEGRAIYEMFNIKHANEDAARIGKERLKRFLIAAGRDGRGLQHGPSELLSLQAVANVGLEKDNEGTERNRVKYFETGKNQPSPTVAPKPQTPSFS